ncbi:MAG: hypothetical protein ACTIBZ_09970 [Corynebacterium variabile]|uniref:hypothetical protein n=2 Tax=Corynebacterium variabile TaxID=1727 RepID=UPI0026479919|nr:hypothetical protein [Corynebacterium variabile]MDN6676755.1 hypothetical protein [Corynebacterium variabile]
MGGALFGQGLNFLAMLLPIVGGETGQLAYLMLPLALATVLSRTSILGFHSRYLTVPGERVRTATAVSAASLSVTTLLCLLVGAAVAPVRDIALWTGLLVVSNGLYLMAVAVATREQRMDIYSTARLAFGITNIIFTALVVFVVPFEAGLIVAAAVNPLVGTVLILARTQNRILPAMLGDLPRMLDREHRFYLAGSGRATGATFLSECGFQIQGFITPFLGQYQEIWAVVVRLTGGFGTLAQQVIAPGLEARIAAAIRNRDAATTARWCRLCAIGGLVLGVLCAAIQAGALLFALHDDDALTVGVLILTAVYCTMSLATNLSVKIPLMKGFDRAFLAWSSGRLVLLLGLLFTSGTALLAGTVVVQTLASVAFLGVALRPVRSAAQ